jgi:hypothetical protein
MKFSSHLPRGSADNKTARSVYLIFSKIGKLNRCCRNEKSRKVLMHEYGDIS